MLTDDSIPYKELDRPGQLNVIVDQIAKDFLAQAKQQPRHYDVCSPSWTLRINNIPIIADIENTLYDLVHRPIAKQYWVRKARITDVTFDSMLWPRLGKALSKMSLQRRLFCSKHTTGMCGVGKFQKNWRAHETDSCPHCGQPKDSSHVWKCNNDSVNVLWDKSIMNLQNFLRKIDTDPDLIHCIASYLNCYSLLMCRK
jgi:hypothetical protein